MAASARKASVLGTLSSDLVAATEQAGHAVVAIHARRRIPSSGIHWMPGVIVAAHHTIRREEDITVTLADGSSVPATLRGRDSGTDLAVLTIAEPKAGAATVADRSDGPIAVGQIVLALGRPGRSVTATLGIVSATSGEWRTWQGGTIEQLVRLDLAVHDGFSGGPLIDADGRVLGLDTSGLSRGSALTIPAPTVDRVARQLVERGRVARGYLGIGMQPVRLPPAMQRSLGLAGDVGLMVVSVAADGPAETAGMLLGDVITALDGTPVREPDDVLALLSGERVGSTITASIVRGGNATKVEISVGERR